MAASMPWLHRMVNKRGSTDPDFEGLPGEKPQTNDRRVLRTTILLSLIVTGCFIAWWLILGHNLPDYATMTSVTTDAGQPTVAWRLFEAGAFAWKGKVYDIWGREVIFFQGFGITGCVVSPRRDQERRNLIKILEADHTVIEVKPPPLGYLPC